MASQKTGFVLALLLLLIPIGLVIIPAIIGYVDSLFDGHPEVPSILWSGIFSGLSTSFENLRKFLFPLVSLIFGITFQELFTLKARRESELNKIERDQEAEKGGNKINMARTFAFSLLILFLIFDITFLALNWALCPLAYPAIWFKDAFFWIFICLIITYLALRVYFTRAKEHFAREILITVRRTRIQKFALFLKILSISSITTLIAVLILSDYLTIPILSIIQGVLFYVFVFIGISIGVYFISKRYFDLNYSYYHPIKVKPLIEKEDKDVDHFFSLSNSFSLLQFQKGFVVLELQGVQTELPYEPNYKVLRFIKELVLEVQFSKNTRRLLFWLFIDGFRTINFTGALQAIAEEFSSLFPMAQTRILEDVEVNELINGSSRHFLMKSRKEVGHDFLNPYSKGNKMDELLRALTALSQDADIEGSIIFNFQPAKMPRKLLKKKKLKSHYDPITEGEMGLYRWRDTREVGIQKQIEFEGKILDRAFEHALFDFDLHVLLKNNMSLNNPQLRLTIRNKIQAFVYKIYNIKLATLGFFERHFLDSQRVKFRQPLSQKRFSVSGDLLKYLLVFPTVPHLNIPLIKNLEWSFPELSSDEGNSIILGKLVEYRAEQFWWFPKDDLCRSIFMPGIPGMGKTTLISRLITEINKKFQLPFLIFDLKGDYAPVYDEQTLWLVPGLNFFLNLFDVKGDDPSIHANFMSELIKSMYPPEMFSPAAQDLLYRALENACRDSKKRTIQGFWKAVIEESKDFPPRNQAEIISGLRVRLGLLFRGAMGKVAQDSPINIYEIFTKKAIIDLKYFQKELGASFEQLNFLTQIILRYLYYHILNRSESNSLNSKIHHVTVIDDAGSYIQQSQPGQPSFLQLLIQLCRSMKEGLVVANQGVEGIDEGVVIYPNTIISFRQPDIQGIIQKKLGLPEDDILPALDKFTAVVRSNQSKMPFLIHTMKPETSSHFTLDERVQMTDDILKNMFQWDPNSRMEEGIEQDFTNETTLPETIEKKQEVRIERNREPVKKKMRDVFREITKKREVVERLKEELENRGFLDVELVQNLLLEMDDPKLLLFEDESTVRGFLKVLVVQNTIFAKKSFKINGESHPVLILAENSHIFDQNKQFFMVESLSENVPSPDVVETNRERFARAIAQSKVAKPVPN